MSDFRLRNLLMLATAVFAFSLLVPAFASAEDPGLPADTTLDQTDAQVPGGDAVNPFKKFTFQTVKKETFVNSFGCDPQPITHDANLQTRIHQDKTKTTKNLKIDANELQKFNPMGVSCIFGSIKGYFEVFARQTGDTVGDFSWKTSGRSQFTAKIGAKVTITESPFGTTGACTYDKVGSDKPGDNFTMTTDKGKPFDGKNHLVYGSKPFTLPPSKASPDNDDVKALCALLDSTTRAKGNVTFKWGVTVVPGWI